MSRHSSRKMGTLAFQSAELALAAPQVITHRMNRLLMAGSNPSARDQHEFYTMGAEKVWAFYESWQAMAYEISRTNMQLMFKLMNPWEWSRGNGAFSPFAMEDMMMGIMGKGLGPVRKRAVANARRLASYKT